MSLPTSGYSPQRVRYEVFVFGKGFVHIEVVSANEPDPDHEDFIPVLDAALPNILVDLITASGAGGGNVLKTQEGTITGFIAEES